MRVSVIIPCHDGLPYLGQAIRSLLGQTAPPAEILVIDDRSGDGSGALAARFGPPVRVFRVDFGHACRARNFGWQRATGDALMFLDADDVLHPTALAHLSAALARHPDRVVLGNWHRLERREGHWRERPPSWPPLRPLRNWTQAWLEGRYFPPCSVLWSRPALSRAGGWDERITINQDGHLMLRAHLAGVRVARARRSKSYYRRPAAGESSLSSRRLSDAGIAGQVATMADLIARFRRAGQLGSHRVAFFNALGRLEAEAGNHALVPKIAALRAEVAPGRLQWQLHRLNAGGSAALRRQGQRLARRLSLARAVPSPVVRYGEAERAPPATASEVRLQLHVL
jgi:O-antigen biosynthesis protein